MDITDCSVRETTKEAYHCCTSSMSNRLHRLEIQTPDFARFQDHSPLLHLSLWLGRLALFPAPGSGSWETHQDTVNHFWAWMSAKASSITGPHPCRTQLWSTSNFTCLLTSLLSKCKSESLCLLWVYADDLIVFTHSWSQLLSETI